MDPYYPTPAYGGIPAFQNIDEEAEFWDTHSILDFPEAIERTSRRENGNEVILFDRARGDDIHAYLGQFDLSDEEPT
jgi:hypothetical protein